MGDLVEFDTPATIRVIESADGHTRAVIYTDFLGTSHYTIAGREIQLNGIAGEDMYATTRWRHISTGYDPDWTPVDNLIARLRHIVEGESGAVTRRYDAMLAKVRDNDVPMEPSTPPVDGI